MSWHEKAHRLAARLQVISTRCRTTHSTNFIYPILSIGWRDQIALTHFRHFDLITIPLRWLFFCHRKLHIKSFLTSLFAAMLSRNYVTLAKLIQQQFRISLENLVWCIKQKPCELSRRCIWYNFCNITRVFHFTNILHRHHHVSI